MRSLSAQVVSRYDELLVCVIKLVDVKYSAIDSFCERCTFVYHPSFL